ncbi:MAG: HYR domain-containing protein, partial [Candidatus Omnitrophica bacterium]|nr:HYR domain-containing protein [Candidatus Omnitrophota bacterium]
ANDGGRHEVDLLGPILGATLDTEVEGLPNGDATGDDINGANDDDGVGFPNPLAVGSVVPVDVTSTVAGIVNYFIDYNADGVFDADLESATFTHPGTGVASVPVTIPLAAARTTTFARFRISSQGGLAAIGSATDGEIEDYQVEIVGSSPTLTCPGDMVVANDPGICGSVLSLNAVATGLPTPDVVFTIGGFPVPSPHRFNVGTVTVGVSATNVLGSASCSFTVTVNDTEIPSATCQSVMVELNEFGSAIITAASMDAGSSDNCGIASMVVSTTAFTCADVGIQEVTLTVVDTSGNVGSCTTTVSVVDNIPPSATAPTLVSVATGTLLSDYTGEVIASDNCTSSEALVFTQSPSPGTVLQSGDLLIEFSVMDAGGNVGMATAMLSVTDLFPDYNYDVQPDPLDGFIDARDLLEWYSRIEDGSPTEILFDFSRYWQSSSE